MSFQRRVGWVGRCLLGFVVVTLTLCAVASAATAVNPDAELRNMAISQQRGSAWRSPELALRIGHAIAAYQSARGSVRATDPERAPDPNPCTAIVHCVPDPRLGDWEAHGGLVEPVLFTARSGATLSGHVWATRAGAAKRPGVLIINGSIVAVEELYWYAAQALARHGYVVMTFDVQGEGMSDQYGEAPDRQEAAYAGTPGSDGLGGSGLPFYDGGADALDFFVSTPAAPYVPVPSRTSGTSHAAKQRRRVSAGLNPAHNPLWTLLDRRAIGIAGHSYGAQAASWLAQRDERLRAAVGWDTLCVPVWPSPNEFASIGGAEVNRVAGLHVPNEFYGFAPECFGAPQGPAPKLAKPALGIAGDYLIQSAPYATAPNARLKAAASELYTKAGADSGQIVIRGGTHYEFADDVSAAVPASLRGIDMTTWYTAAWFDKYLKHDPTADDRLLSARWRDDRVGGAVDPSGDSNLFSYHYRSRLDVATASGGRFRCEDLRSGCSGQPAADADCGARDYSFLAIATAAAAPVTCTPCSASAVRARTGRRLWVTGRASTRCRRIDIAIARVSGHRCEFLTPKGQMTRSRNCDRPVRLRARGTARWRFTTKAPLSRGRYRIYVFATDIRASRERRPSPADARFRVN